MWAQMPRREVAYGYMGCGTMYNLGTNLGSVSHIKTDSILFCTKRRFAI
jgi:hypothetical protein